MKPHPRVPSLIKWARAIRVVLMLVMSFLMLFVSVGALLEGEGHYLAIHIMGRGPYWVNPINRLLAGSMACVSLLYPSFLMGQLWRRCRPLKPGTCIHCGYSLTGNTSGVCPECGMAVPSRGVTRNLVQ